MKSLPEPSVHVRPRMRSYSLYRLLQKKHIRKTRKGRHPRSTVCSSSAQKGSETAQRRVGKRWRKQKRSHSRTSKTRFHRNRKMTGSIRCRSSGTVGCRSRCSRSIDSDPYTFAMKRSRRCVERPAGVFTKTCTSLNTVRNHCGSCHARRRSIVMSIVWNGSATACGNAVRRGGTPREVDGTPMNTFCPRRTFRRTEHTGSCFLPSVNIHIVVRNHIGITVANSFLRF